MNDYKLLRAEHGIEHKRSQGLIDFAYSFAKEVHEGQKRKYTEQPILFILLLFQSLFSLSQRTVRLLVRHCFTIL